MGKKTYDAVVVGGGLAGASAAFALAKRSLRVLVLESSHDLATQASGNRFGLIMPYLTDRSSPFEKLYGAGFSYTHEMLTTHCADHRLFRKTGGVQFPATERLSKLLRSAVPVLSPTSVHRLSPLDASEVIGVSSAYGCFHVPEGGYISPASLVRVLIGENISQALGTKALSISRRGAQWSCLLSDGEQITTPTLVVCAAYRSHGLSPVSEMPLEPVHGQTVTISPTDASARIRTLVCFNGYMTPQDQGSHLIGAHYQHFDLRQVPCDQDSLSIISRTHSWLPSLDISASRPISARVCFRTSTHDRLPYIGQALDTTSMLREAAAFRSGTDLESRVHVAPLPGVFMSVGHGSRGLLTCPLGGELVARLVTGEPLGNLSPVAQMTSPARITPRLLSLPSLQRT